MSDAMITGKIYFTCIPFGREMENFVAFLSRCAEDNQIWINTGTQIKNSDARYKYCVDNSGNNNYIEKHLYFEITDDKESDDCSQIISGISYRDTDFGIADWGSSGIPNVQNFLVQIMAHDLIEYVQLSIDLAHGYTPSVYENLNITANEFCKTLMSLPNHNAVPTVQFNIRKLGDYPCKSMKGYKNINCSRVETELIELCKEYLNEQFDQAIFRERITALVNEKYDASEYSFEYMLLCGYINMFSEYEPDECTFRSNVEKVLSEIENEPYISETWLVRLEKTENKNINLLYECWKRSEDGDFKDNEHIYRELERIEKSKIQYPASIRDVVYNNIVSLISMWDSSSADICVNHSIGTDACTNHKIGDKLNYLFDIWFGKEKLFFQFNYIAGDIYICIL